METKTLPARWRVRRAYRVWGRMRRAWLSVKLQCALAWRALFIDLSNFLLIEHRRVGGFLISGKNSGTHWLRFMLSHAMARRYGCQAARPFERP